MIDQRLALVGAQSNAGLSMEALMRNQATAPIQAISTGGKMSDDCCTIITRHVAQGPWGVEQKQAIASALNEAAAMADSKTSGARATQSLDFLERYFTAADWESIRSPELSTSAKLEVVAARLNMIGVTCPKETLLKKGVAIVVLSSPELLTQELSGIWKKSQKDRPQQFVRVLDKSKPWKFQHMTKYPLRPSLLHETIFNHACPGGHAPVEDPDVDGLDVVCQEMCCRDSSSQVKKARLSQGADAAAPQTRPRQQAQVPSAMQQGMGDMQMQFMTAMAMAAMQKFPQTAGPLVQCMAQMMGGAEQKTQPASINIDYAGLKPRGGSAPPQGVPSSDNLGDAAGSAPTDSPLALTDAPAHPAGAAAAAPATAPDAGALVPHGAACPVDETAELERKMREAAMAAKARPKEAKEAATEGAPPNGDATAGSTVDKSTTKGAGKGAKGRGALNVDFTALLKPEDCVLRSRSAFTSRAYTGVKTIAKGQGITDKGELNRLAKVAYAAASDVYTLWEAKDKTRK
ncbi:unnamed protein product [Prorocentrum cordatum]|uniref:Uncharacterized protein n=1 Tax=Prorocentrum cordatum TaxID=2364126 RepID=A0ABN9VPK3_9DINO|nr:unnamed protein product [Polarella glacialis]